MKVREGAVEAATFTFKFGLSEHGARVAQNNPLYPSPTLVTVIEATPFKEGRYCQAVGLLGARSS